MPNDMQPMVVEQDGSLMNAALNMPDFDDISDPSPDGGPPRDVGGRFLQKKEHLPPDAGLVQPAKKAPDKIDVAPTLDEDGQPVEDIEALSEDEYFEFPAEKDGEKPLRLKASEVVQGYHERETLKRQVAELQKVQVPPRQYEQAIHESIQSSMKVLERARMYEHLLTPQEPDMDLINEESPRYNPGAYQRQKQVAEQMLRQQQQVRQEVSALEQRQTHEQKALLHARTSREQARLYEFWPELQQETVARQVADDLYRHFGIDQQTLGEVLDHRFFAVAKVALEQIRSREAAKQAVKVVRSKPRLVKGAARDTNSQSEVRLRAATQRLISSNSVEDAAAAIGALGR